MKLLLLRYLSIIILFTGKPTPVCDQQLVTLESGGIFLFSSDFSEP